MGIFKRSSAKSGGAKKSASAPKKRATEKKAPPTKKAAAPKPAAKPAPKAAPKAAAKVSPKPAAKPVTKPAPPAKTAAKEKATSVPTQTPPRSNRPSVGKPEKAASKRPGRVVVVKAGTAVASKLGTKWNCFRCSAKFYDLNKPVPLCPKCGADQRQRPKVAPTPTPAPEKRKQPRPMAPLLEDEDDGSVRYEEDIDLGVRTEIDEPDEELFQPGEFEEDDVFSGPEEE